ncbi:MADF domain-containing protein [Caenorhabditis elegans]|uniref:MADF domain-containing protein n=1 Tax=Caenorhabditis elegans TaxID=6239 RepID=Q9TZ87_CAEEL|nr:MADF domain-containing protein [Caenorhabditis elegans]CCD64809.1 MADF domain-containing protein [Caenorhabditis elegans]|eukprot:NP_494658.1 LIn-8 Domain containing [Caenorhabditis elegans]
MNATDYRKLTEHIEGTKFPMDNLIKKVFLNILEPKEDLWNSNQKIDRERWETVGIELFQRTGILVSVDQMRSGFRSIKSNLGQRLHNCVQSGMSRIQTELELQKWELFQDLRFYYDKLYKYRQLRAERTGNEARNSEPVSGEDMQSFFEEPDMMSLVEENDSAMKYLSSLIPQVSSTSTPTKVKLENPFLNAFENPMNLRHELSQMLQASSSSSSIPSPISPPVPNPKAEDEEKPSLKRPRESSPAAVETERISQQIKRIFEQYPEKTNLIRSVLTYTVLAFDEPDADFSTASEVFGDLAARFPVRNSKR